MEIEDEFCLYNEKQITIHLSRIRGKRKLRERKTLLKRLIISRMTNKLYYEIRPLLFN